MSMSIDSILDKVSSLSNVPLISFIYIGITVFLSAITSYIRTQSYQNLIKQNSELLFDDIIIPSLQLVPSHIVFHPWTLWTSTFVETSPFQFISGLFIIYFGISFLESQWNPNISIDGNDDFSQYLNTSKPITETLKFTTIIIISSNLISLLLISLINIINNSTNNLNLPLQYGLFILVIPISVVAKQLTPETNIKLFSLFKFRLKRLPLILLLSSLILSILKFSLSPFLPGLISFLTSWYYLRYIQYSPAISSEILPTTESSSSSIPPTTSNLIRGDPSDTFAIIEFFPEFLKSTLKPLFDGIYQLSALLGIIKPWNDNDIDIGNLRNNLRISGNSTSSSTAITHNLQSNSDIDSERRKQIALKVLENSVDRKD
ncbi:hypothetical protein DAPK24_001100 [Pichia kluyveri]|uniref:Rhomboid-like protein 19 n=1 Tax=Pichia kluyveri TaxID=36015 RepID=A0AAV5QX64_PICKL|nr:hypothetical protein DAPK24_001100 [Pichia kluyveri]